jgi:hypothetical protein
MELVKNCWRMGSMEFYAISIFQHKRVPQV